MKKIKINKTEIQNIEFVNAAYIINRDFVRLINTCKQIAGKRELRNFFEVCGTSDILTLKLYSRN